MLPVFKSDIYDIRRYGKAAFLLAAGLLVGAFLYISSGLVADLSGQERDRMEIWAEATKEIVKTLEAESVGDDGTNAKSVDLDFLLSIIERNTTIPVLLVDQDGNLLQHRNFTLPEPGMPDSEANTRFLEEKVADLKGSKNAISIEISPGEVQTLYYEDSTLLKRLSYFPYVELVVMLAFVMVVYFAVVSTKKAEQNKVWVGLSKETAHQLGTPISSLMAWMELLPEMGVDAETVGEMNKDVKRLSTVASRFSKIGSKPTMETGYLGDLAQESTDYMRSRISPKITVSYNLKGDNPKISASLPLFEWVLENLVKNAVDAISGAGSIIVTAGSEKDYCYVEVSDTGKGIPRKNFKTVFNPGFTTKKRGWGLGLTLAKRIVEQYHGGRIYVKTSTPGAGTTFRIDLPKAD